MSLRSGSPRFRSHIFLSGIVVLGATGCPSTPSLTGNSTARGEVWFNSAARPGGDGSREHPFQSIPVQQFADARAHFLPGTYAGPFICQRCIVEGDEPTPIIQGEPGVDTVVLSDSELSRVSIVGGVTGLVLGGKCAVNHVSVAGTSTMGVQVLPQAQASLAHLSVTIAGPQAIALKVDDASIFLDDATVGGVSKRGLSLKSASGRVQNSHFSESDIAIHALDSTMQVAGVDVQDGAGAGIFAVRGRLRVAATTVTGHEYGLQTGVGTVFELDGFASYEARLVGVSIVQSSGRMTDLSVDGRGRGGALSVLDSDVELQSAVLTNLHDTALFQRQGVLRVGTVQIREVNLDPDGAAGDAVVVRDGRFSARDLQIADVEGNAVTVSMHGVVTIDSLTSAGANSGALMVDRGASAHVQQMRVTQSQGPVLGALEAATVEVDRLVVTAPIDPLLVADCAQGAKMRIGQLVGQPRVVERCVSYGPRRKTPAIAK